MATKVNIKDNSDVNERENAWSSIFPPTQNTRTHSAVLFKKLLAVAVSNIAYLRALLPESAFSERKIVTFDAESNKKTVTNLKILRDDSPAASKLIKWLRGCFEALDKRFLRAIILGVISLHSLRLFEQEISKTGNKYFECLLYFESIHASINFNKIFHKKTSSN